MLGAMTDERVRITGMNHVGIRVHDLARARAFYELLGFVFEIGPVGPEPVAIMSHPSAPAVNFILNAPHADAPNVLMDVPDKHPGFTHIALSCPDLEGARRVLEAAGHALSGGPVTFPTGARAIFVRDPDRNTIELHQEAT